MERDRDSRAQGKSADDAGDHTTAVGKQTLSDNLEGGLGGKGPSAGGKGGTGSAGKITATTPSGTISGGIANISVGTKVTFTAQEEGRWRIDQQDLGQGTSVEYTAPETPTMGNDTSTHQASTTVSYPFTVKDQALGEKHTISTNLY